MTWAPHIVPWRISWHAMLPGRVLVQWGIGVGLTPPHCRFLVRVNRLDQPEVTL